MNSAADTDFKRSSYSFGNFIITIKKYPRLMSTLLFKFLQYHLFQKQREMQGRSQGLTLG